MYNMGNTVLKQSLLTVQNFPFNFINTFHIVGNNIASYQDKFVLKYSETSV